MRIMFLGAKSIIDRIIWYCFASLAVITPIIFSTKNTELFEVPKMIFVYLVASVLLTVTLLKFAIQKKIEIPTNIITIAFFVFLTTQAAATITSIDKFTSIFGYPSRLNGGLLSLVSYFVIFATAVINLDPPKAKRIFIISTIAALAIALWGIPAHFGKDPNCLILTGNLDAICWQKEFNPTKRIFSTLGQPNWLASYFVLIIPVNLALVLISKRPQPRLLFSTISIIVFIAFIFTNSRSGVAGLAAAILCLAILLGQNTLKKNRKIILPIVVISTAAILFFGITLFARIGEIVKGPDPTQPSGTESTAIRKIVWLGAIEVFKKYPVFGSGPETFTYSYYEVRPHSHNKTTEWNFFYNKAHNEFLNYLAGSGFVGLLSYLGLLLAIFLSFIKISKSKDQQVSTITKSAIAAFLGYQLTIFFGFSTVATQVLFFLFAASVLILSKQGQSTLKVKLKGPSQIILATVALIFGILLILSALRIYLADFLVARARSLSSENPKVIELYKIATKTYPGKNPFYLADFANESAYYSQPELMANAKTQAEKAAQISPNNLIVLRRVANTYFLLSQTDKQYEKLALSTAQRLTILAPTDPQSYLTLAKIQGGLDKLQDAKRSLEKALELKPDYVEALELLDQINSRITND